MDILDFSDLSEDWVSQPQSSDPADAKDNLVLRSSVRSKIPIPSRRSVSNPYKVLHEKTASDNNSYCSTNILRISSREIQPEAFSETIQRKDAAKVTDENQETPEWKKKLLRGNGKSQDLFSPIGLQGVFKPPTIKTHTMPKSRSDKLGGLINIPPSSPPAMPGQLSQISTLSVPEESLQLPPLRAPSQTGPKPGVKGRNGSTVSSNKSAISHERFSPVMFGSRRVAAGIRQTSIRDNTRYPSQEFKRSLSSMSDSVLQIPAARSDDDVDSVSLPEYSELDSEHISLDQKFITTKRGGFSADGSFKIRPLTPSSYQPGILSSIPPTDIVTAPDALITPKKPLSTLIEESPQRHKSSGSPLKLFDKYDTFTNDRLNCRVSQFEGREGDVDDLSIKSNPPTPSPQKGQAIRREQRMSSFGEGRLDEFDFTHNTDHGHAPKWPSDSDYNVHGDDKVNRPLESPLEYGDAQHVFKPTISKNIDLEDVLKAPESDSEIKRMPSSPQRVSYPKRRRTNDHDPESECDIDLPRQRPLIKSKSSIAGKKWKDARHGDHNIAAGPEVLAERQILEPISSVRKLSLALGVGMGNEEPQYINVNTATDILANQLASLALNVAEDVTYGNRKKSVTTADFFKEAHIIMQHIRTQAAQDSQTPSVIVQKSLPQIRPSGFQDELFSNDDLDRPASREGGGTPRKRGPVLTDRVVSHLKKFADSDDLGLAINSSFNILKLKDIEQDQDLDSYTSDRSDIRILDPPRPGKSEGHAEQYGTGKTDSTGNTTTSIPTGSSGTRSKAIIEPHKISHLLADTMGGMTFDHQRQCWVKRKSLDSEQKRTSRLESEMTEDDPFAGIPDLDDDLLRRGEQIAPRNQSSSRPTTAYTHDDHGLASSGPVIDTRATSWSTAQPNRTYLSAQDRRKEQMIESALLHRGSSAVSQTKSKQPRAVTVAFSSPPIQPSTPTGNDAQGAEIESIETPNDIGWSTEADRIRLRNHLSSSVVKYTPRPLSRIDEMDNSMELVNSSPAAHQDMSLRVVTPAPRQRIHGILVPATNRSYVSMQLTPLQDFTVHQIDDSLNLDVQYVARKQGLNNQFEIEDRFSISVKELVAKIADIEPYEPYWEYMKELDLSNNGLVTLHMLDEFCSRLETLSIDGNELGQLNGAPGTIRMLSACSNCFSDLTAWDHLYNLQYLDVSGNELRSLKGFSNLVHLRELRADNNQIQSLDGVTHLDGLLRLSLVNNAITEVDLKASRLPRLELLDLSDNNIAQVAGLGPLTSLQHLILRKNKLISINFNQTHRYQSIKLLNLAENKLTHLDVTSLHNLYDLNIDFNSITTIQGLKDLANVKRVSWRYQHFETASQQSLRSPLDYSCCIELKHLNLSGNRLLEFSLSERFLNLERLDLASCGIRRLASDFGANAPNLRLLNLNHNALREIQPLEGIKGVSQLYLVNNRLKDFRQIVEVVCKLGKKLRVLDCRNNPFNAGYYLTAKDIGTQLVARAEEAVVQVTSGHYDNETFMMPDANVEKDEAYLKQIDFGTLIRRRVYELMLSQKCERLGKLDGMPLNKDRIENKDKVWERLLALGIVQSSEQEL